MLDSCQVCAAVWGGAAALTRHQNGPALAFKELPAAGQTAIEMLCLAAHFRLLPCRPQQQQQLSSCPVHPAPAQLTISCLCTPPRPVADLARVKDEKHLQRPQRGQWAVMLEPLPPEKPTKKKEKPADAEPAGDAEGVAEQLGQAAGGSGEGGGDEAAAGAAALQDAATAPPPTQ